MKFLLQKAFFLLLLCPVFSAHAQNLTGIWRGLFQTDGGEVYKLELQIKQSNTGFKGVTYSYLNTVFYGKATLSGSFNKDGQSALIKEIKTVELRMSAGSVACIMKYLLDYSKSGKEEFLEGVYSSVHEKDSYGSKKGEDCGSGTVRLRKVKESDFYVEPFLRNKASTTPKKSPPLVNQSPKKNNPVIVNKPTTKKLTPAATGNKQSGTTAKIVPPVQKKLTAPTKPGVDSTTTAPVIVRTSVKPVITTPAVLKNRQNELMKSLVVTSAEVTVKLYDNGEIDGDTISVYLDKKLVLSNKRLTAAPLIVQLKMDESDPDHELVMVAENLGRIPPNTSLMIVEAGEQRFDVRITSTEQKNAVVKFKYQKP